MQYSVVAVSVIQFSKISVDVLNLQTYQCNSAACHKLSQHGVLYSAGIASSLENIIKKLC